MADYSNKIRRVINRNKKYLIRLKVQQVLKYGEIVYELREIDESIMKEEEEVVAKPAPVIIPEEQINQIIEQKWEKLVSKL